MPEAEETRQMAIAELLDRLRIGEAEAWAQPGLLAFLLQHGDRNLIAQYNSTGR